VKDTEVYVRLWRGVFSFVFFFSGNLAVLK
jgi:hypothetical protein